MNTPRTHTSASRVEAALRAAFGAEAHIEVRDDSAAHAGHAGAREGSHMHVRIQSAQFAGLSRVARHRLVYGALSADGAGVGQGIHALSIDALSSDEPSEIKP